MEISSIDDILRSWDHGIRDDEIMRSWIPRSWDLMSWILRSWDQRSWGHGSWDHGIRGDHTSWDRLAHFL